MDAHSQNAKQPKTVLVGICRDPSQLHWEDGVTEVTGIREESGFTEWILLNCCVVTGIYPQQSSAGPGSLWNSLMSSLAAAAAFNSEVFLAEGCLRGSGLGDADGVLQYISLTE